MYCRTVEARVKVSLTPFLIRWADCPSLPTLAYDSPNLQVAIVDPAKLIVSASAAPFYIVTCLVTSVIRFLFGS